MRIVFIVIAFILFYISGWDIMIGEKLEFVSDSSSGYIWGTIKFNDLHLNVIDYYLKDKSYFVSSELFIISINDFYYGVYNKKRFFDSLFYDVIFTSFAFISIFYSLIINDLKENKKINI